MHVKSPSEYKSVVTPYHQRLLQFGVDDSKVYLSEAANDVFRSFTHGYTPDETNMREYDDRNHAIIDGGYIQTDLDSTSTIRITLSRSSIIADKTLLIFPEETTVDLDVTDLDDTGEILVFLNYMYLQSPAENRPYIKALYYDGTNFTPDEFEDLRDLIILTRVTFTKDGPLVTNIESSITDPYMRTNKQFMLIGDNELEIAPLASIWYRLINGMKTLFANKETKILDDPLDWIPEVPSFGLIGDHYCATIDFDFIDSTTPNVSCYIDNVLIVPAAIQSISSTQVKIFMPQSWATEDPRDIMHVMIIG